MILRCWLVVWVKWARPLVSMTLWSRVMFNWKAVQLKGRPISWAVLHHWKSMGQILVPSCPPGVQLLPHFEVWSYRACQPLQMSPPPCLYDTVIQSYVQLKSGSIERTAHFMGRPTPLKVNGANFSTLLPPRGATFTPFWGMVLQSLPASSNVANFTFLWNPLSELRGVKSFSQCKVNGATLGRSCPPGVQLLPHFEVWSYRACQPLEMWQISHFCEIHSLSYEASKFFAMLSQCVWFCPYFAPGANIVPPIAYKSHSTRFPIRPHVLTPHSWLCDKNCGRSSAPK